MDTEELKDLLKANGAGDIDLKTEFNQLRIRMAILEREVVKEEAARLKNPLQVFSNQSLMVRQQQLEAMGKYKHLLQLRAEIEGVELYN